MSALRSRLPPALMCALLLVLLPGVAAGAPASPSRAELTRAVDEVLARHVGVDVPGAVVAVVDASGPVLLLGRGRVRHDAPAAVDPTSTRFPVASVAKVVTATTALAMAHTGRLDLDAPVGAATGIEPREQRAPLTLRHLLTHTAGLDEPLLTTPDAGPGPWDLATYMAEHPPVVGHAPGLVHYSPLDGYGLLGVGIARAGGAPFADVVAGTVTGPLGMARTDFDDLTPPGPDDAVTHVRRGGGWETVVLPATPEQPAASLRTTAADMGALMTELLAGGRVLPPAAVREALAVAVRPAHGGLGRTGAFFEGTFAGVDALRHVGGNGLASVVLFPDAGIGVFVAGNAVDGPGLGMPVEVADAVARLLPPTPRPARPEVPTGPGWRAEPPAGAYQGIAFSDRLPERSLNAMNQVRVAADGDAVTLEGRTLRPAGPGRWCDAVGCVAGRTDGDRSYLLRSDASEVQQTLVRVPWWRSLEAVLACGAVALLVAVGVLVVAVRRFARRRRTALTGAALAWAVGTIGFAAGLPVLLSVPAIDPSVWVDEHGLPLLAVRAAAWLSLLGAAGVGVCVARTWRGRSTRRRVRAAVLVVGTLASATLGLAWGVY